MRSLRWIAAALLAVAVLAPPAAADAPVAVDYRCVNQAVGVTAPDITTTLDVGVSETADPVPVFQPVTWTLDLAEPDLAPPVNIALHYFRVRIPLPPGLTATTARVVAAPGETPLPALADLSVTVEAGEVVVQIPAEPAVNKRIFAATDGRLLYPYTEGSFFPPTAEVVLPQVQVTAHPTTPAATLEWRAPELQTVATTSFGNPGYDCAADAAEAPVVGATTVSTAVATCDGRPVTVQVGHNAPTAGADVIQGTAGNDVVSGLGGNDRFCGLAGLDTFRGGGGNDRALGGSGNDTLRGDAGTDRLVGEAGNDTLVGGSQRDTCVGGPGRDSANGCEVRQSIP